MDSGQLNGDQSIQETYAEPEAVGGGLRYFDEERLGTATDWILLDLKRLMYTPIV